MEASVMCVLMELVIMNVPKIKCARNTTFMDTVSRYVIIWSL